jgi:hypothetical protein
LFVALQKVYEEWGNAMMWRGGSHQQWF